MAETFNLYEAILWFVISVALLSTAVFDKSKKLYKINLIASAVLFFFFGVSDYSDSGCVKYQLTTNQNLGD